MPADINDHPDLLGQGNELIRPDDRSILPYPAHQRFETDDPFAGDLHDRLIINDDLIALQGVTQLGFNVDAIFVSERQLGLIELEVVLAELSLTHENRINIETQLRH